MLKLFGVQTDETPTTAIYTERGSEDFRRLKKKSIVDHLHVEAEMLKVREHQKMLSAQYLARCLEPENYTVVAMKLSKQHSEQFTLTQSTRLSTVKKGISVLDGRPPLINNSETS